MNTKRISKYLSLILRHQPEKIGLKLDKNGWVTVDDLLDKMNKHRQAITMKQLEVVVETNDKQRFSFNDDKTKIRANQGHSIQVDVELTKQEPPEFLYHGTVGKFLSNIKDKGLQKMSRQHVHLSKDLKTAQIVGGRRGIPVLLTIRAKAMYEAGYQFYISKNGVWLTDKVPVDFIEFN